MGVFREGVYELKPRNDRFTIKETSNRWKNSHTTKFNAKPRRNPVPPPTFVCIIPQPNGIERHRALTARPFQTLDVPK